jgi:hypothetical protein
MTMINREIFSLLKQKHKRSLIVSCILATVGLTSIIGCGIYFYVAQTQAENSVLQLKRAQAKYRKASKTFEELSAIFNEFSHLQKTGFIGDEKRLNWVETLNRIVSEENLPKAEFHAMRRRDIDIDGFNNLENIFITPTEITLYLLHERDFFRVYQRLSHEIEGLFIPLKCEISRLDENIQKRLDYPANLEAKCTIQWFSLMLSEDTRSALENIHSESI